jgi:hypothetical protein
MAISAGALQAKIRKRLRDRLFACRPDASKWPNQHNHVLRAEDVLVDGVSLDDVREDFESADGGELRERSGRPPKFHAVHSSSALVVNTLGSFRRAASRLQFRGETGFQSLRFEFQCPTGAGRGRANLDVLLSGREMNVAIESKLTELLTPKTAKFSSKYDRVVQEIADRPWRDLYRALTAQPTMYQHLDAAQLVKHYLGLRTYFGVRPVTLVYLFWEPTNATAFEPYRQHAVEVEKLTRRLSTAEIPLVALRYSELWDELESADIGHVSDVRKRYAVAL